MAAYCAALEESSRFNQVGNADFSLMLSSVQRALALDSNIADAYGIVASAFVSLAFAGEVDWREAARKAHAAIGDGLTLAPDDPRLLHFQGNVLLLLDLDYTAAKAKFNESLARDPIHPDAHRNHESLSQLALAQGNVEDALEHAGRALRIDDSDVGVYMLNAGALYLAGHYRDAIKSTDAGLKLVESGANRLYIVIIKALAQAALGESHAANATLDDGLATVGRDWRAHLAGPLARLGRTEEARQLIAEFEALEQPPMLALWAMVAAYAALDHDRAFDLIHVALDRHSIPVITTLRWDPRYSEMRQDARWARVMRHLEAEEARTRAGNSDQE